MHEMTLAQSLLDKVLTVAGEHHADRVTEVSVALGVMQQVVPEALELAFQALTEGTIAQSAQLHQQETPIRAQCRSCGTPFPADLDTFQCPNCGRADVAILEGNDIVLNSVVCEQE